jgi:hypothetical protein
MCDILRDKQAEEDGESQLHLCIVRNISASANSRYQALQKYLRALVYDSVTL